MKAPPLIYGIITIHAIFRKFELMRNLLAVILIVVPVLVFSQEEIKLKKKYLGHYKGTIDSYLLDTGNEIMTVGETAIYVEIGKDDKIKVTIGSREIQGTYHVMFKAKTYYLLDAQMEGQLATERIMVYKRGKHIARDGMYPQPVTELTKFK